MHSLLLSVARRDIYSLSSLIWAYTQQKQHERILQIMFSLARSELKRSDDSFNSSSLYHHRRRLNQADCLSMFRKLKSAYHTDFSLSSSALFCWIAFRKSTSSLRYRRKLCLQKRTMICTQRYAQKRDSASTSREVDNLQRTISKH